MVTDGDGSVVLKRSWLSHFCLVPLRRVAWGLTKHSKEQLQRKAAGHLLMKQPLFFVVFAT